MFLTACASGGYRDRSKTTTGAVIGGAIGAAAGSTSGDKRGALYGAIAGALIGSAVGNYMDAQQQKIEDELSEELASREVEIYRLQDETIKLSLNSKASFDTDSTTVKPIFRPTLDKLSQLMSEYDQTALHIIGHTDSSGSDKYNQMLSQRRAAAVATEILNTGVSRSRFNIEGRGELQPRQTNTTYAGRRANRRVEIYIKPIVEGEEQQAFTSPAGNA